MKLQLCIMQSACLLIAAVALVPAPAQIAPFLTPVHYAVPGASMAVLADVNHDGILDIVTANGFRPMGSGISVMLGNGDGTFQAAQTVVAGGNPSFIVVGDFNNDGKLDIAVANEPDPNLPLTPVLPPNLAGPTPTVVSLLLGNGDGTFQPSIDTPTLGAFKLVAADFNGDGTLDLAITTGASTPVQILLGHGDGNFTVNNGPVNAVNGSMVTGDFNGDGRQDILTDNQVLLGNGDGTFVVAPPSPLFVFSPLGASPIGADINGDGILDMVSLSRAGRPPLFAGQVNLGAGNGTWSSQGVGSSFTSDSNLIALDFNGDGKLDVFGNGSLDPSPASQLIGGLFLGHGDGTFTQVSSGFGFLGHMPNGTAYPVFSAAGDMDGNGSPDVAIADGNGVTVALNTFGNPALLAQVTVNATSVVGASVPVSGTVSLGGPAPAGNATVTLSSSSAAAVFPGGSTVTIPAGQQSAIFSIATAGVAGPTPVTISAAYRSVLQAARFTIVQPFSIASVSVTPGSLFGMFGGNPALVTVNLSGPASDGVVVNLSSANSSVLSVPAAVSVAAGATSATFPVNAAVSVPANTAVAVSGSYQGGSSSTTVLVRAETPTIIVTKSQYTVSKSQLNVEATSTDRVGLLQIYNAATGAFIGTIPAVGNGKFVGQLTVRGPFTTMAVQSTVGGLTVAAVPQK